MTTTLRNKAYKFRIYPNHEQKTLLAKSFGCTRFVYNHYLNMRKEAYETDKTSLSYYDTAKDLVFLKKEYEFLKEVDSISLQQSLRHLDQGYQNFFQRNNAGYPKFKLKKDHRQSYSTICVNNNIKIIDNDIILPKLKRVKMKKHRSISSTYILKSATLSMSPSGKYFVSILFEYQIDIEPVEGKKSIGLDFSMPNLFVSTQPEITVDQAYLHNYRKAQDTLAREQRKLSHCQKGSSRYHKQRIKVARKHEHVANQRKDYLHKTSRLITNTYDVVCIEDLDMQAMSQSLHFGISVADNGWGMFTQFLTYKLEEQGKQLVKVDKWYPSSKTCHVCGYVNKSLTLSDRTWVCPVCSLEHDRDYNASINIKRIGMQTLAA